MSFMPLDNGLKGAFNQIKDGTAFNRSFESAVGNVTGHISGIQTKIGSMPSSINGVADSIVSKANNIGSQITSATNRIPAFASHVTKQFNDLANNISTFASSQGLKNALSGKAGGCSNMKDFFGSITTDGPKLIGEINLLVDNVSTEIDRFTNLGATLQGNITASYDEIVNQLNAEISSAGADIDRITDLNAMKDTLEANFRSGVAEIRADLAQQAQSKLNAQRRALVDGSIREMRLTDLNIQGAANKIETLAGEIDLSSQGLQGLIDKETATLNGAVSELETLGQASGMRSLFGSNPCVQTLLGFVGETNFLKNLKG
jgi:archaellum component FlaC